MQDSNSKKPRYMFENGILLFGLSKVAMGFIISTLVREKISVGYAITAAIAVMAVVQ